MAFDNDEFKRATDYSQIAYLDCLEPNYMKLYNNDKNYPTLHNIIKEAMGRVDYFRAYRLTEEDFRFRGQDIAEITIADVAKYSSRLTEADKNRIVELSPEAFSYKIQDVYNTKNYNGFYACYIDRGNGEKVIGIRGCENFRKKENLIHDWEDSSFGLVQSEETPQQGEIRYLLRYLRDSHQFEDCEKLTIAGHSLGGNLASHAAVVLQESEFAEIADKLDKTFNLDGPGVSRKYLEEHEEAIEKIGDKDIIQHVSWSVVGNLLFEIPNSFTENIKVYERKLDKFIGEKDYSILGQLKRLFCKHSTVCVTPNYANDPEWNVVEGEKDGLSKFLGAVSRTVDEFVPEPITYAVGTISSWLAEKILVTPEEKKEFPDTNNSTKINTMNKKDGLVLGEI